MDRSVNSSNMSTNNERTTLLQTNCLLPAMSNPLGSLRPTGQIENSQHPIWITPTTGPIIQRTKKPSSPASEQEDRDSDPNTTSGRPPGFQPDHLTSESLSSDGFTTITTSPSFGGDRVHGSPSDLAKSYCHSNFATKSHAGAPKTLSILPNPTLACGHSSVDSGCTGSPDGLDDSRLGRPTCNKLKSLNRHEAGTSRSSPNYYLCTCSGDIPNLRAGNPRADACTTRCHSRRNFSPLWEYSTVAMLNLPELAVASPSSQPNLVLMTWTPTELVSNPVSPIRIQLHHTGEQLTGVVQK
jgi:hypothetical protein